MPRISTDDFLEFCRSLEGEEICTLARRTGFIVCMRGDGVGYIPGSGKLRFDRRMEVDDVLRLFEEKERSEKSRLFKTTEYRDLTFNASYLLTLIDLYRAAHRQS